MQASYGINFDDSCCAQRQDERDTVKIPTFWGITVITVYKSTWYKHPRRFESSSTPP
jgi:hypothetical protein